MSYHNVSIGDVIVAYVLPLCNSIFAQIFRPFFGTLDKAAGKNGAGGRSLIQLFMEFIELARQTYMSSASPWGSIKKRRHSRPDHKNSLEAAKRVGALTLVFAALSDQRGSTARLPKEKLIVG